MISSAVVLVGALAAMVAAQTRNDLQNYLASVYTAVPASDWAKLNDQGSSKAEKKKKKKNSTPRNADAD
jgi:hypothetical protein